LWFVSTISIDGPATAKDTIISINIVCHCAIRNPNYHCSAIQRKCKCMTRQLLWTPNTENIRKIATAILHDRGCWSNKHEFGPRKIKSTNKILFVVILFTWVRVVKNFTSPNILLSLLIWKYEWHYFDISVHSIMLLWIQTIMISDLIIERGWIGGQLDRFPQTPKTLFLIIYA